MIQYVMQASPLTRIRLPEWHIKCLNNPDLINSPEPFTVTIPRTLGAIQLVHKKVTLASSLRPKIKNRLAEEDEVTPLVHWLTSPHEMETDIWGVVALKVDEQIADQIIGLVLNQGDAKGKAGEAIKDLQRDLAKSFQASQREADERVTRALARLYNVVKGTVEFMKKNNMGVYSPSYAEALALHTISDSVKQREVHDVQASNLLRKAFDATGVSAGG